MWRRCVVAPFGMAHVRWHSQSDMHHNYLHRPHIVQHAGVDPEYTRMFDQQMWNNTEQWGGYSETYLARYAQYESSGENSSGRMSAHHPDVIRCLNYVHQYYGTCAERLEKLHDDPLRPEFHSWIASIRADREKIAEVIDKHYASLHPTVKTIWDAFLVKRYYHLGDWLLHVEKKRENFLNRLSPEHIDLMTKARGQSEMFIERLSKLKDALTADPTGGLLVGRSDFTEVEAAMIRQKARYFRNIRRVSANVDAADTGPQ